MDDSRIVQEPARITITEDGRLPLDLSIGESVRSVIETGYSIGSGIRRLLVVTSEGRLLRVEHMDDDAYDRAMKRHDGAQYDSILKPLARKHAGAQIGGEAARNHDWMKA